MSSFSGWAWIVRFVAGFCQNLLIFAGLTGFRRDLGRSQWDKAESWRDLEEIRRDLNEISMDLEEIKRDLEATEAKNLESNQNTFNHIGDDSQSCWFFPPFAKGSWPLSDRLDKIDRQTTLIDGESYFWWVFRSGRLKIGFPSSNLSTDPLISGFGSGDPSLTVAGVRSAGSWAGSVRLGRWVDWRV